MRQRENTRQDASVCVLVAMATAKGSSNSRRDGDCTVFLQVAVFNLRVFECVHNSHSRISYVSDAPAKDLYQHHASAVSVSMISALDIVSKYCAIYNM